MTDKLEFINSENAFVSFGYKLAVGTMV